MAYTPTYEEFEKALKASGLGAEFSPYDLALAREDPAAGMSILSDKQDWHRAKERGDSQGMSAANDRANVTRAGAGNYSGGGAGVSYRALSPEHRAADALQERLGSYGAFAYEREPDYQAALEAVAYREPFSYAPEKDPVYGSYRKAYVREGRRAGEDTLGQYAALTGGRPSTAAVTASQQAGNYYAAQLADKLPELYEQAYQRYLSEYTLRLKSLNALASDRSARYGEYGDTYDRLRGSLSDLRSTEDANYRRALDQEQTRYQRSLAADETAYQREQTALDRARQAELDRYSREREAYSDRLSAAKLAAQYGDYGGLRDLGIEPDTANVYQLALAEAGRTAPVGSGSVGGGSGAAVNPEASPYSDEDRKWARSVLSSAAAGKVDRNSEEYRLAWDILGWTDGDAAGQGGDYGEDDRIGKLMEVMAARGAPYQQVIAELEAELRDGNLSRGEYDGYLRQYTAGGLEDGIPNLEGAAHRNGLPMSRGFAGVWKTVRALADLEEKPKALEEIHRAVRAGTIHDYEIDVMLDQLGW